MDDLLKPSTILENFLFLSRGNSISRFNQARMWRKKVISNSENIFILINFFQENNLSPECQIFVLKIIRDIIDVHLNSIQLTNIALNLAMTKSDKLISQPVTFFLGNLIGYITRFVYQKEHIFLFPIPEGQTSFSKLQWFSYHEIIEYMDQPRSDCTEMQNNEIVLNFKNNILLSIFHFSLNALDDADQTADALHLLLRCLQFDDRKNRICYNVDQITSQIFNELQNEALFSRFAYIIANSGSPMSSDTLDIVASILHKFKPSFFSEYNFLFGMVISFISEILLLPDIFRDQNNINSFKNIFQSFPSTIETDSNIEQLCLDLIHFLNINFKENFLLVIDVIFPISQFFEIICPYLSQESQLFNYFSSMFDLFIQSTLIALENDPINVYNSFLLDSTMRKETNELIKHIFMLSTVKQDQCIVNVCAIISDLGKRQFNRIINLQIGFLLYVIRSAVKILNCAKLGSLIFNTVFSLLIFTNDKINDYRKELKPNEPFSIEFYTLFFLKSFSNRFFTSDDLEKSIPTMSDLFPSPEAVVIFVFQRFWNDAINNVCFEKSSKCLRNFIDISNSKVKGSYVVQVICNMTKYPVIFLENYLTLPSRPAIYYTIINVMLSSNQVRQQFLKSLEENFADKFDDPSLIKLFKLFFSCFDSSNDLLYWRRSYIYFFSNFMNSCIKASTTTSLIIYLLKLLYIVISHIPKSNPFKSDEPYSIEIVKNFMLLLSSILNQIIPFLSEIPIDESIYYTKFEPNVLNSRPISLSEAQSIGLNESQMKIKKMNFSKIEKLNDNEYWSFIEIIIIISKDLINSSIPNFGLMEFYNDNCVFVFFDLLIDALSKTTIISLVSQEQNYFEFVESISDFIFIFTQFFKNDIVRNSKFSSFVLSFIRFTFLSNNSEIIKKNCNTLCLLISNFKKAEDVEILRSHFILSLNAALYFVDCFSARKFVFEFSKLDPQFFLLIGSLIEKDLNQDSCKNLFHKSFQLLLDNMASLKVNSSGLYQPLKFCFEDFLDSIAPLAIKLYSLPSLEQYFNFHS